MAKHNVASPKTRWRLRAKGQSGENGRGGLPAPTGGETRACAKPKTTKGNNKANTCQPNSNARQALTNNCLKRPSWAKTTMP